MRYIVLILITLMCSLSTLADSKKPKEQNTIDDLSTKIKNNGIDPIDREIASINKRINSVNTQLSRIKDRKFKKKSNGSEVERKLSGHGKLEDIYNYRRNLRPLLEEDGSDMAQAYILVIDMIESLHKPYDEDSNNKLIKRSSTYNTVLPQHQDQFNEFVSLVNDYNYYMYELARLFIAADEDGYKTPAKVLADQEDAPYLIQVPYTSMILEEYINNNGQLPPKYKEELIKSSPYAFSDLK